MKITGLKHIILRFYGILAAVLISAAALMSCSGDSAYIEEPVEPADDGMLKIRFQVAAPEKSSSRADDGSYEEGSALESTIDFVHGSYRVYFFDTNGVFITEWKQLNEMYVLAGEQYWVYTFVGKVPEALKSYSDFKVMVLANWSDYPERHSISLEGKSIDDVIEDSWSRFSAFDNFVLSVADGRLIPFYGLSTFTGVTFKENKTVDLGSINLLRAMAKIEVIVESLPDGVEVEGLPVVRGINPEGYCAPKGTFGSGNNWDTDYVTDVHLPFDNNMNHADAMENSMGMYPDGDKKWIAYVPEFRNAGAGNGYSRIELKLNYHPDPFIIYFAKYDSNGRPDNVNGRYNIQRNDLYRFRVKGEMHEILFDLTVEPWVEGGRTEIDV